MNILEVNAQTGEAAQREMTTEELGVMQEIENQPATVPTSITPRQIRLQLLERGITLTQIDAIIDALPEPQHTEAKVNWEYATSFDRNNELLNNMAPYLGLSSDDLDQIFINGQTI